VRAKENPYFAKMLVNRYWKHFFSRGLVEPEDDIRPTNPATHPALFDELASSFVASGFDLKQLIRTITNSRTYQMSGDPNEQNAGDEQNYARYYPKRLQAEVLLDSVNDVTGAANSFTRQPQAVRDPVPDRLHASYQVVVIQASRSNAGQRDLQWRR
jgi:hypothetical protein